ncbi:hypothetical protein GCM10010885_23070 [Alicyclobacillus cellulosilyticus]|uniref:Peptidase U32-like protein n=1 Tax=Alicyclobacillus cellulosilyticus TaxID=1003997 RepID=A0A917KH59_9BACL|nr:U32 family peptidase [Alicyclobacillus cellulosilyticus]GGJ13163.1 hypothetical protein GCM10010885_23070 [Alicyclobacillus cellulosilyticus]
MYDEARAALKRLGLPDRDGIDWGPSTKRFTDGAQVRVEIPSCEGPRVLRAVLEEAERLGVRLHRVSQGSGVLLLTDEEIREMARLGAEAGIEVSLFIGPRAGWHLSPLAKSDAGGMVRSRTLGVEQMVQSVEEVKRAYALGIRSVLVADDGLLWVLGELRSRGEIPADMKYKVSVMMGVANPATALLLERYGADTINVSTDLSLGQLAAVRAVTSVPLDIYVEVPDDLGGFVRYYEIPELISLTSPVYIKYGLRNAPNLYPSGGHLEDLAITLGRERVRRARIGQELMERYCPGVVMSKPGERCADLAVPVVR